MSLKTEVFEVLRQNLILVRPEYGSKDVVLCPICMREIPRQAVQDGGIEHVIPENVVKLDNANISGLGTQNQRWRRAMKTSPIFQTRCQFPGTRSIQCLFFEAR